VNKHSPGPWIMATSNSWRRILTERGDPVCVPVIQVYDHHPDLHFPNGGYNGPDATLILRAPELLEENERLRDENKRYAHAINLAASQHLPQEVSAEDREHADYEGAYVALVKVARAALEQTNDN
jgi:hypothetical protein